MFIIQETGDKRHPDAESGYSSPQPVRMEADVPLRVRMAMNFVAHCNQHMGFRCWPTHDGEGSWTEIELHYAQEKAFRVANQIIGNYFAGKDLEHGCYGDCGEPGDTGLVELGDGVFQFQC